MEFLTLEQLEALVPDNITSPADNGTVELIVVRREIDHRELRSEAYVSVEQGLEGDSWYKGPDVKNDTGNQITLINRRFLEKIALEADRMPLAGDNFIVDLDLSESNLKAGDKIQLGDKAVLEITDVPHLGCRKFLSRFGADALKFVNTDEGRKYRLRGVHGRVIEPGLVRTGDVIRKVT